MTFIKMQPKQYPRRLWAIAGEAGTGKSTFATNMSGPLLLIDADHRFDEVVALAGGDVLSLSDQPIDHIVSDRIAAQLRANMPAARVGTIVVDSLTAIIKPLMVRAVRDNDAGVNKNKVSAFKDKATAMSQIQDAVTAWGTDVLWIWHLQQARNEKAVEVTRATISDLERVRLQRSLNLELHVVVEGSKRGVKVAWVRKQDARSGVTVWDESGRWLEMPAKIEAAVYAPKVVPAVKVEAPAPVAHSSPPQGEHGQATPDPQEQPHSELDAHFGPNPRADVAPRQIEYETIWPASEAEFIAWLKTNSINGKETHGALGTDAKTWLRQNAGKTWADVAKTVAATLGK